VTVGQTPQRTLTISNGGNATLNVSGITYPSGFSATGRFHRGGRFHDVSVTFSPRHRPLQRRGHGRLGQDRWHQHDHGLRQGSHRPTRVISLSNSLDFGDVTVGQTPQRTLTISNSGNATLNVSGITYPSGFSGNWSGSIAAGGSHDVSVTFSPTAQTTYSGAVTVASDKTMAPTRPRPTARESSPLPASFR